jgi:imidazole glycerol phosphate synthase subunit HisF
MLIPVLPLYLFVDFLTNRQLLPVEAFDHLVVFLALAAGIFHREEVPIEAVKEHMREKRIETR